MTLQLGGDGAITGCTSLENPDLTVSGLTISGSFDAEKVLVASGTAAAPSYTFSGDTDNGLYYAGTNSIGLSTAGTNAILIDSGGNVGVGATSTTAKLRVIGNEIRFSNSSNASYYGTITHDAATTGANIYNNVDATTASHIWQHNGTEVMRIDSSGTLTVGPQYDRLNVNPGSGSYDGDPTSVVIDGRTNDGNTTAFKIDRYDGSGSASTKFFINYAGQVGIGTASPQRDVHIHNSSSSTNTYLQLTSATTGTSSTDGFQLWAYGNGGNLNATIAQRENADLEFWTNNTEAMRLDSFGSLIIGDTQPGNTASYARNLIIGTTSGNNGMSIVSGTDSAGTINFSDGSGANATQGIIQYEHLSNFMRFYTADTERMRLDSSGRLSLGATSSTVLSTFALDSSNAYSSTGNISDDNVGLKLFNTNGSDGTGANNYTGIQFNVASGATSSGSLAYVRTADNQGAFVFNQRTGASSYAEAMRLTSSGHLLIGTSTSTSLSDRLLQIGDTSSSATYVELRTSTSGTAGIVFSDGTSGTTGYRGNIEFDHGNENMLFYTAAEPRMRLDNTGMLRVRGTSTDGALNVFTGQSASNSINLILGQHSSTSVTSGTLSFLVLSNGDVKNSNNTYGSLSDISLKENIVDANSQWDDIKSLRVRNYNFKEETGHETFTQIGVIAQEIETVSPGLVSSQPNKDEEGNDLDTVTKAVKYSVLYMKAVKALQEAMERIETLEAEVAVLKNN